MLYRRIVSVDEESLHLLLGFFSKIAIMFNDVVNVSDTLQCGGNTFKKLRSGIVSVIGNNTVVMSGGKRSLTGSDIRGLDKLRF